MEQVLESIGHWDDKDSSTWEAMRVQVEFSQLQVYRLTPKSGVKLRIYALQMYKNGDQMTKLHHGLPIMERKQMDHQMKLHVGISQKGN